MNHSPAWPAWRRLAAGVLALCALAAAAQTTPAARRPDPLDPQARVPAPAYRSPFPSGKDAADDKPVPWQTANETVGRIGGWRVYAREAAQPQPPEAPPAAQPTSTAPAAKPAQPAAPAPAGPAGHKMP